MVRTVASGISQKLIPTPCSFASIRNPDYPHTHCCCKCYPQKLKLDCSSFSLPLLRNTNLSCTTPLIIMSFMESFFGIKGKDSL